MPAHGEIDDLCFVSVAQMVCISCAFVYDAVNVNKIVIISSTKLPSYPYVQVTTGLILYTLADVLIYGERVAKFQCCRLIQTEVMAANVSACS